MSGEQQAKHIVVLMTDSQGTNVVGCYGRPEMRTPRLDRLATEGVQFDRAYTTSPLCTPARAGIFTGTYSHLAGASSRLSPSEPTYARSESGSPITRTP